MRLSGCVVGLSLVAVIAAVSGCSRSTADRREPATPLAGTPGGSSTSRDALMQTIATMRARVAKEPGDVRAAVQLADALLRQTRVTGNGGLANEAEQVLGVALARQPDSYDAHRMRAAVYLSQHRFRDALAEAHRCVTMRSDDAWILGVIGDAHLELGEYQEAFDAFDRMAARRPDASSYARVSYARELQGDLPGALKFMQMAAEATGAGDPESLAWHHAQVGHLQLEMGQMPAAAREFARAEFAFPGHPFAAEGLARVAAAEGRHADALAIVTGVLATAPTPAMLALAGDLEMKLGRPDEAERHYRLAEAAWQSDAPEPSRLARFLAERGRSPAVARR
jgi:tetratricopeptide (TPR) repeat protein